MSIDARHGQRAGTSARDCILCGKCLEVCPLVGATGQEELSPKAKNYLLGRLAGAVAGEVGTALDGTPLDRVPAERLASVCLACGRCEKVCPQELCVPDLLRTLRAAHPGWRGWLWRKWIEEAPRLWPAMGSLSGAVPRAMADRLPDRAARALAALRPLSRRSGLRPWITAGKFSRLPTRQRAVLFPGCVAAHARTDWRDKAVDILDRLGYELAPADGFGCCGCTLGHAGLPGEQAALRRDNLEHWRSLDRPLVVTLCATCRCGLKAYGREPLEFGPGGTGEADAWSRAVVPLSGLLLGRAEFRVLEDAAPDIVAYHEPCHGSGGGHDLALLRQAVGAGAEVRVSGAKNNCCGFGGMMQLTDPALSGTVAAACWGRYGVPGEPVRLLSGCSGCVVQLAATAPAGCAAGHWLEIFT